MEIIGVVVPNEAILLWVAAADDDDADVNPNDMNQF